MAATADHSPRNSGGSDASAAKRRSPAPARGLSSPWTQAVRGAESESESESIVSSSAVPSSPSALAAAQGQIGNSSSDWSSAAAAASSTSSADDSAAEAQSETSDNGSGSSNAGKKPAWNKPSNGAVEVGPVMGADSWPALSESTRAPPKSSLSDLVSQGMGSASSSSSHEQVITSNINPSLVPNHVTPTSQKSMKHGGGNITANGVLPQPMPPSEMASNNAGKPGSSVSETSSRDYTHKESGRRGGFGSHPNSGNDHSHQQNSYRRGNGTPGPRGDGSYHHNYGGRQDRGNHHRNSHRSFNGGDAHMQPQSFVPRGFIRPPPHSSTPFIPPPPVPVRPFGNPMVYPEVASPMIYVPAPPPPGVPIVSPIPPRAMFFPVPDPLLHSKIVSQIDYYFSYDNLVSDTFLRQNMDEDGWVPIQLVAGFKKVRLLTNNIPLILDALRNSNVVEVKNDKVRKRDDWRRWIMPPPVQFPNVSSTSLSGDLNTQSQPSSGEGEHFISARSSENHAIAQLMS